MAKSIVAQSSPDVTPICDLDSERYLIGAALVDQDVTMDAARSAGLTWQDFYASDSRSLWKTFQSNYDVGLPFDHLAVGADAPELRGVALDAQNAVTSTIYVERTIAHVLTLAAQRRGVALGQDIVQAAYAGDLARVGSLAARFELPALGGPGRRSWSVSELYAAEFADVAFTVPGMLPAGLTILGGRPKMGKSWLGLQMAVAVATGGRFLGRQVSAAKVLYLALEDDPRRMRDRLRKMSAPENAALTIMHECRSLADGGTADLIAEAQRNNYQVVIIDTLSRALGSSDQMDMAEMTTVIGGLQRLAITRGLAVLVIDHHRKAAGGQNADVIDDISGSTAKAASADAAWGICRKRGERFAKLTVTGRDIEDAELAIEFDDVSGCWQEKDADAGSDIFDAIRELGGAPSLRDIADFVGRDRSSVYRALQQLVTANKLIREELRNRPTVYKMP